MVSETGGSRGPYNARVEHILGQSRAIDILHTAFSAGRLHHALIFHGPAGVGKFTTALALAKLILCHDPQRDLSGRPTACDACESCRLFRAPPPAASPRGGANTGAKKPAASAKGRAAKKDDAAPTSPAPAAPSHADATAYGHPDLHIVMKELARYSDDPKIRERKLITIPVDVIENRFLTPVYRASSMRHGKVVIVDEAELMDRVHGQNRLLKALEEPPADTHIILVTANEDRLLPTIRSRCERVAFVPLPDKDVEHWLARRSPELPEVQKSWLVEFSAGSLGRAELAMRYGLFAWAGRVLPAIDTMARGAYPADLGLGMKEAIDGFAEAWVSSHENASKEAANKLAAALMWTMVTQHARRKLADLSSPDAPRPLPPGDLVAAEAALSPWLGVIDAVANAEHELDSNVNLGLVTDHVVARMHAAFELQASAR